MMFIEFLPTMKKIIKGILGGFTKRALKIEKRIRFVTSTFALSCLMLLTTFFFFDKALIFLPILILASYFFTFFAVLEGIEEMEWFSLFIVPVILTFSFYLFYFLFPVRWLTRIPFIIFYGISIYANLLASNIFNVKMEKSLQLYRAAFSVNFFFHTIIIFLLFNNLLSFHLGFILNGLVTGAIVFLLSLQLYWSVKMPPQLDKEIFSYALLTAIVLIQLTVIFSFVAVRGTILALFLAASYYSLGGLIYSFLDQRLFKETVREYLFVWGFVFVIILLALK